MKKRVSANKIYWGTDSYLLNGFMEIENGKLCVIGQLSDYQVEPSGTIFYNGIIVVVNLQTDFVAKMKQKIPICEILKVMKSVNTKKAVQLFWLHTIDSSELACEIDVTLI